MARGRKRGHAARNRDRDADFNANQRSPTKKGSPRQSTNTSPRKGRKAQQQETVDEGVAAKPDDFSSQAYIQIDGSTYASSPLNETSQDSPSAISARKNAAQGARGNNNFDDPSPATLGAEQASSTQTGPSPNPQSKVVVLKLPAHKLQEIVEAHLAPERKVIFKVAQEQLGKLRRESGQENLESEAAKHPGTPQGGESAGMAPVKEKNPHDVLDGESIFTRRFMSTMMLITHGADHFKNVIQNLYDIGSITHGYLPESHEPLFNKK